MPTMIEYKCPCCGGVIEFDSASQQMKCPFCDTTFDLETLKSFDEALKQDQPQEEMKWDVGAISSRWFSLLKNFGRSFLPFMCFFSAALASSLLSLKGMT